MLNIVVLVSGSGTNLQALIDAQKNGEIKNGKITCVISSKPDVYALERAKQNGIATRVLRRKDYGDIASYSKAMLDALNEEKADLVVYAGFMTILDESRLQSLSEQDDERTPCAHSVVLRQGLLRYARSRGRAQKGR